MVPWTDRWEFQTISQPVSSSRHIQASRPVSGSGLCVGFMGFFWVFFEVDNRPFHRPLDVKQPDSPLQRCPAGSFGTRVHPSSPGSLWPKPLTHWGRRRQRCRDTQSPGRGGRRRRRRKMRKRSMRNSLWCDASDSYVVNKTNAVCSCLKSKQTVAQSCYKLCVMVSCFVHKFGWRLKEIGCKSK